MLNVLIFIREINSSFMFRNLYVYALMSGQGKRLCLLHDK